jgi:hypothetical protein
MRALRSTLLMELCERDQLRALTNVGWLSSQRLTLEVPAAQQNTMSPSQ